MYCRSKRNKSNLDFPGGCPSPGDVASPERPPRAGAAAPDLSAPSPSPSACSGVAASAPRLAPGAATSASPPTSADVGDPAPATSFCVAAPDSATPVAESAAGEAAPPPAVPDELPAPPPPAHLLLRQPRQAAASLEHNRPELSQRPVGAK